VTTFDPVGDIVRISGQVLANPVVHLAIYALIFYVILLWVATAWWVFADAASRTRQRWAPYAASALILLFSPLFFLAALLLYRLIRPSERSAERLEREYSLEALSAAASVAACPYCAHPIENDWLICPFCCAPLRRTCPSCQRAISFEWVICAYCGQSNVIEHTEI